MPKLTNNQARTIVTWLKNYVDRNKQGRLEFNEDGNLIVTINGVSKEFTPGSGGSSTISYIVHYELTECTSSNTVTSVNHGDSYTTTLSVSDTHTIQTVTVIMGGIDITSTAYNSDTKTITIPTVTGNISITVSASAPIVGQISADSKEITLTGLPAGTYTLKYESDDGIIEGFDDIATMEVQ